MGTSGRRSCVCSIRFATYTLIRATHIEVVTIWVSGFAASWVFRYVRSRREIRSGQSFHHRERKPREALALLQTHACILKRLEFPMWLLREYLHDANDQGQGVHNVDAQAGLLPEGVSALMARYLGDCFCVTSHDALAERTQNINYTS